MRLNNKEKKIIKENTRKIFGEAKIILFGSRIDDKKSGGDIDLYIIPKNKDNLFIKKLKLKAILEDLLFKPVDIIIARNENRLIEKEASKGVELWMGVWVDEDEGRETRNERKGKNERKMAGKIR